MPAFLSGAIEQDMSPRTMKTDGRSRPGLPMILEPLYLKGKKILMAFQTGEKALGRREIHNYVLFEICSTFF